VAYVETQSGDGMILWGVGRHESILTASLRAIVSAVNRRRRSETVIEPHRPY
jgi:2-isopropylmalate synthase